MCRNEIQFSGVHAIFLWFISVWLWSIYKPINNSYAHKSFTLLWHDLIKFNVCQFVLSYIDRILWLAKSQPVLGRNFRANLLSGNRYVPWFDPICGRTFADSHQFSAFFGRRRWLYGIYSSITFPISSLNRPIVMSSWRMRSYCENATKNWAEFLEPEDVEEIWPKKLSKFHLWNVKTQIRKNGRYSWKKYL